MGFTGIEPTPHPPISWPLLLLLLQVDALAPHVREAKHAVYLGSNPRDYTNKDKLLQVCVDSNIAPQFSPTGGHNTACVYDEEKRGAEVLATL